MFFSKYIYHGHERKSIRDKIDQKTAPFKCFKVAPLITLQASLQLIEESWQGYNRVIQSENLEHSVFFMAI